MRLCTSISHTQTHTVHLPYWFQRCTTHKHSPTGCCMSCSGKSHTSAPGTDMNTKLNFNTEVMF